MGRSTKRNVTVIKVSTDEIKDVFNSDASSKPISEKIRKASEFFVDGAVDDSIYEDFIDPDNTGYCLPDPTFKKTRFIKEPRKWGYWRNYGGSVGGGLPEIYWSDITGTDNTSYLPSDYDIEQLIANDGIYVIPISPDLTKCSNYIDSNITNAYNLPSTERSIFLRKQAETSLNNSLLATRVGIDYPNGEQGVPRFKIKVTPYLDSRGLELAIGKSFRSYLGFADLDRLGQIASTLGMSKISDMVSSISSQIDKYYFQTFVAGELQALRNIKLSEYGRIGFDEAGNIISVDKIPGYTGAREPSIFIGGDIPADYVLVEGTPGTSAFWGKLSGILNIISTIIQVILIANDIWDKLHPEAIIVNGTYQFRNSVLGMYKYSDIDTSFFNFKFGNKHVGIDSPFTSLVSQNGVTSKVYSLNDPNYGNPFSASNLIPNFPAKHPNRDKYLNMQFFPKCIQYDYNTPPPTVNFLVELIAESGCKLSETKLTSFVVGVYPDKYYLPKFSIDTDVYEAGSPVLYNNTSIKFKNAKFVDFVYLKDTEKSWFFSQYYNFTLNRDGINGVNDNIFFKPRSNTFYNALSGNDLIITPSQLFNNTADEENSPQPFAARDSFYETYFMQESQPNILYNPTFRTEGIDVVGNIFLGLKKFWQYDSALQIRSGAIYKDAASASSSYLYQSIPRVARNHLYTFKISVVINSGSIWVSTNGTWNAGIYSNYIKTRKDYVVGNINLLASSTALSNYNIKYLNPNLEFTQSGSYYITLKSISDTNISKIFRLEMSNDFTGHVTECYLQKLLEKAVGKPNASGISIFGLPVKLFINDVRGAYNAVALGGQNQPSIFNYKDSYIPSKKMYLLYTSVDGNPYTISFILAPNTSATVKLYSNIVIANLVFEATYVAGAIQESVSISEIIPYVSWGEISITTEEDVDLQLISFTCNDAKLLNITDVNAVLSEAEVDLSGTDLYNINTSALPYAANVNPTNTNGVSCFQVQMKSLDLSDTDVQGDLSQLPVITKYLNISNTQIASTKSKLVDMLYLKPLGLIINNTNVSEYGFGNPSYGILEAPVITWKNSNILVEELNLLIEKLDETATENGYLDIAGDNPEITDTTALAAITNMIDNKGWNVLYNTAIDWTYEGVMTVGEDDNPIAYSTGYVISHIGSIVPSVDWYVFTWGYAKSDPLNTSIAIVGESLPESANITSIYINGNTYTPYWDIDAWIVDVSENPFPPVGETCDIKLLYTLA